LHNLNSKFDSTEELFSKLLKLFLAESNSPNFAGNLKFKSILKT